MIEMRCKQGKLIVNDQVVRIQLFGLESRTMARSAIVAIDYKLTVPSIFGFGGGATLIFHDQGGDHLRADLIKPKIAKEIVKMLGY